MRAKADEGAELTAAYREGLGLAAITVSGGEEGIRITAARDAGAVAAAESPQVRWWCRNAEDAVRIAAAAARKFRSESNSADAPAAAAGAAAAVLAAARRCNVALYSDADIGNEADKIAARIDAELRGQRAAGGLKAVNKAYRSYRLETSGRGERALLYDEWMRQYRANLVRRIAAALRRI